MNNTRYFKMSSARNSFANILSVISMSNLSSFSIMEYYVLLSCRWDFCFYKGSVIEHLDGHTDIVHKLLNNDWLPWSDPSLQTLLQMSIMPSSKNHENAL